MYDNSGRCSCSIQLYGMFALARHEYVIFISDMAGALMERLSTYQEMETPQAMLASMA